MTSVKKTLIDGMPYGIKADDSEPVVTLACEGGGMDIWRIPDGDGWKYFQRGSSIAIDDNDHETWNEWKQGPYSSLAELLDDAGIKEYLRGFSVTDHNPECRDEILDWVRPIWYKLASDFSPESWIEGRRPRVDWGRVLPGNRQ